MAVVELDPLFLLFLVVLTSLFAFVWGSRRRGWPRAALPRAAGKAMECVGAALVFLAANLAVGLVISLLARSAGVFVSLYLSADVSLLVLSALQALVFLWWREESSR